MLQYIFVLTRLYNSKDEIKTRKEGEITEHADSIIYTCIISESKSNLKGVHI